MRLQVLRLDSKLNKSESKQNKAENKKDEKSDVLSSQRYNANEEMNLADLVDNLENLSQVIVRVADFSFPLDITLSKTDVRALLYDTLLRFHDDEPARRQL
jgi:hypothetical protein